MVDKTDKIDKASDVARILTQDESQTQIYKKIVAFTSVSALRTNRRRQSLFCSDGDR